jgi:hypothetical protein
MDRPLCYTPKTVNNRVQTLQHLYHLLNGETAPTPADEIKSLAVPDSVKVRVPARVFRTFAANLTDPKTRGVHGWSVFAVSRRSSVRVASSVSSGCVYRSGGGDR